MQIDDFIIDPECTVIEAMKRIDNNGRGIIYICQGRVLEGVLTDGDIRRYIIKNGNLGQKVSEIANMQPHYLLYKDRDKAKGVLEKQCIQSLPIIDNDKRIIEVRFLQGEVKERRGQLNIPVVIMAGGKGTRLYPYTQILPKPLIPIGEKTITEHIMDHFVEYGCTHFDMIVNYKKNFIKSYFLDNEIPVNITFIEEDEFLGTGGGLKLLEGKYKSSFFMSNCDIIIEGNYEDMLKFHKEGGNIITMVCATKQLIIPYGTVQLSGDGQVVKLDEKPELSFITNTGFYIIEPEFLHEIPQNTFIHITDIIQKCIDEGKRVGIYPVTENQWLDMGQLDELERMRKCLEKL